VQNKINIYLIDDHSVLREVVALALASESDMTVVGQAGTAKDALREVSTLKPDVVLVDLNIPDRDGVELLTALRMLHPPGKLLVLSSYDDEFYVAEALRAGAHGYLVKTALLEEVLEGIRCLSSGGTPLSPRVAAAVTRALRTPLRDDVRGLDALTTRELQVLRLLTAGVSTTGAAARLIISPKTVETHRLRLYAKLGCKNVVELARIALRNGLLKP
jgi:DNA-binding NarL/FixJ family response regulator